jgi:hypothetical protein
VQRYQNKRVQGRRGTEVGKKMLIARKNGLIAYLKNPNAQQCLQTKQTEPNEVKDLQNQNVGLLAVHKIEKLLQKT